MRVVLRVLAILLFLSGFPIYLGFLALFIAMPTVQHTKDEFDKFLAAYTAFALGGLLSGAGALLWAVVRIAYPRSTTSSART